MGVMDQGAEATHWRRRGGARTARLPRGNGEPWEAGTGARRIPNAAPRRSRTLPRPRDRNITKVNDSANELAPKANLLPSLARQ
jgi:hypothetical protein